MKRIAFCVAAVVVAAGCASTHGGASRPTTSAPSASSPTTSPVRPIRSVEPPKKSPRDAALALSKLMAAALVLPPGSVPSDEPVPQELRGPWLAPAGGNLVGVHRLWFVQMDPDALVAFLKSHTPPDLFQSGFSPGAVRLVVEQPRALPTNVAIAGLEIAIEPHGSGSLVNVLAGGQWTALRPAGEIVGARDRVVVVSEIPLVVGPSASQPPAVRRVVVTGAQRAAIVTGFNALPTSAVRLTGCFALGEGAVTYRVAFATDATAVPDVVATIAPCQPIGVTVNGHRALSLTSNTGAFGIAVANALGQSALSFSAVGRD